MSNADDYEISHLRELLKEATANAQRAERASEIFVENEEKVLALCQQAGIEVGTSPVSAVAALVEQHAQVGVQMVAAVKNERLAHETIAAIRAHAATMTALCSGHALGDA